MEEKRLRYGKLERLRRNGRLTVNYFCRVYDPVTRTNPWRTTGCRSLKAAGAWREDKERKALLPAAVRQEQEVEERTFAQTCESWLETKRPRVTPARFGILQSRARAFWWPLFGRYRLSEITAEMVDKYLARRKEGTLPPPRSEEKHRQARPVAAVTVNDDLVALRNFFTFARRHGWLAKDPSDGAERFRGEMRRRVRTLTPEEERRLLDACEAAPVVVSARRNIGGRRGGKTSTEARTFTQTSATPSYLRPIVEVALYCGFRRRTILSLQWRHADLDAGRWRVPAELMKSRRSYEAPIPVNIIKALHRYRGVVAEECERKGVSPTSRLAPTERIFGLSPDSSIGKSFQRAVARAGVSGLTFHDLRRVFLNNLRALGVSLEAAMELTGHASLAVVLKHYREVPAEDVADAVKAMGRHASAVRNAEESSQ